MVKYRNTIRLQSLNQPLLPSQARDSSAQIAASKALARGSSKLRNLSTIRRSTSHSTLSSSSSYDSTSLGSSGPSIRSSVSAVTPTASLEIEDTIRQDTEAAESEFKRYIAEGVINEEEEDHFDLLRYWQVGVTIYHICG